MSKTKSYNNEFTGLDDFIDAIVVNLERLYEECKPIMQIDIANNRDASWYMKKTIVKPDKSRNSVEKEVNIMIRSFTPAAISVLLSKSKDEPDYRASLKLKETHVPVMDGMDKSLVKNTIKEETTSEFTGLGTLANMQLASVRSEYEMRLANLASDHINEKRFLDYKHENELKNLQRDIELLKKENEALKNDLDEAQTGLLGFNDELEAKNQSQSKITEKVIEAVIPLALGKLFNIQPEKVSGIMDKEESSENTLPPHLANLSSSRISELQVIENYLAELDDISFKKFISIIQETSLKPELLETIYELIRKTPEL